MSEERNNVEVIPEFKMYITDLETNKDSKEINVSDLIFNDYIEFEFGDYEDEDYGTLPYKDFKFFINDYSVTFYSPQMKDLQQKVEQLENIRKEAIESIENNKETREHYEPYGTPMGNPNYTTTHIFGYYELLDILNKGSDKNGNNTNKTSTRKTEK